MEAEFAMAPVKRPSFGGAQRIHDTAGYKVKLCQKAEEKYICPLCSQLMRDPVQTYRGVLACASCYDRSKSDNGRCPVDGEEIDPSEIFVDKAKNREIMFLDCYCMYKEEGCTWTGKVKNVEDHEDQCLHRPQTCRFCNENINSLCTIKHLNDCEKWLINRRCLYDDCPYQPSDSNDLKTHLESEVFSHAILHTSAIERLQMDHSSHKQHWEEKRTKMENSIEDLKCQIQLLVTYTTDLQNKYDSTTNLLEKRISQLETARTDQVPASNSVTEVSNTVRTIQAKMQDLNLRQQLSENTSYDGRLLWKIDNVTQRLQNAQNGAVTALHSAPVFTSRFGYKFCARLYLNGDGIGKFTHASLFFVMMRGDYDDVLQWPFDREIKFRLLNLKNIAEDVVETFKPDPKSSSFLQPKGETNIASGCPLFVKQEQLLNEGFIKNDTIFIEISAL